MASSSKKDEDSVTKHIVDYYKKFSQNKELPKYFSGTSLSYLPEIENDSDSEPNDNVVKTNIDIVITPVEEKDENCDISPTSSLVSNRKLEWDNGADIGYANYQHERRSSLPIKLEGLKSDRCKDDKGTSEISSSTGSNVKLVIYTHSSSSDSNDPPVNVESSSSSSFHEEQKVLLSSSSSSAPVCTKVASSSSSDLESKKQLTSFKSTLSFLKKKIGMPDAQSTPYGIEDKLMDIEKHFETPVAPKTDKPIRRLTNDLLTNAHESSNSDSNDKVASKRTKLKSALKKPYTDISKPMKKVVTLCLTKPLTVECTCSPQKPKNKVVQVKSKQSTIAIQTDDISEKELIKIISKAKDNANQSVVYYEHSGSSNNVGSTQTSSDILASNCDSFEYVKNVELFNAGCKSDINQEQVLPTTTKTDDWTNNLAFAKSLPQKSAQCADSHESSEIHIEKCKIGSGIDLEKNIEILQKLVKSKKYDSSTKKRYIRKIIQNITESKFLEDSSTSSELFFPKKSNNPVQHDVKVASTETSSEGNERPKNRNALAVKTFSHNISPRKPSVPSAKDELTSTSEIIPTELKEFRKNLFTLTNNEFSVNQLNSKPNSNEHASLEKQYESSSSARSYQNWKADKTLSERVFEGKHSSGDGNSLTINENKERDNQLVWIDKEIDQLEKMKKLLAKPHEEKYLRRTTSVYRIERHTPSKKPRKYVIETQLNGKLSRHVNYNIDGKKYLVNKEDLLDKDHESSKPSIGDIEVESSDTTMKIKVTTFCQICKRSPCVCVTDFLGGLANPFHRPEYTESGNQDSCSCASRASSTKTVCLVCHKKACICKISNSGRCSVCKSSPCSCSSSYAGQFLAAQPPKSLYSSSSKSSKSKSLCSKCGNITCSCQNSLQVGSAGDTSEKSTGTENGSLKKVFENCACNTETTCRCNFVEKLLKHFNVKGVDIAPQKPDPGEHIGIQTSIDIQNKSLQTSKDDQNKISQTHNNPFPDCKTTSVQTKCDTKSQNSQTAKKVYDNKTIQTDMPSSQFVFGQRESERKEVERTEASTYVDLYKKELTSKDTQTADIIKVNVAEQASIANKEDPVQRFDKYIGTIIGNRDSERKSCSCTQTETSTYPLDKRSQTRSSKSEKKLQFIGSDTELVKAQRKQSIGCNCNIFTNDVFPKSSSDSWRYRGASKTNNEIVEHKVATSSVGTCRCGFSDKVYNKGSSNMPKSIPPKSNDAQFVDPAPEVEIVLATSSTNSGTERTASSEDSSMGPSVICISCDKRRSIEDITILAHNKREFPLCNDCLERRPMLTSAVSYTGKELSSNISSETDKKSPPSKDSTVQTENDEYCTCTKPTLKNNSDYCSHCLNRLKKTVRNKNGIAYTLTLENESPSKFKSKKRKKKPLEEIKVKVPGPHGKKRVKDNENFNRRSVDRFKRIGRSKCDENNINSNSSKETASMQNGEPVKIRRGLTLQDYLKQNRPDFYNSAEFRRQTVNDYRVIRELTKDHVKLKFLEEHMQNDELNKQGKLFSEKEITKRNYKKLPEVQQKLTDDKHRRLRTADKFIVDTFAKKLQRAVLKGKSDFPLDTNIVSIVV